MKVISLWQPWASLWIIGLKEFETRSWEVSPCDIAVHASKKVIPFEDAFGHAPDWIKKIIISAITEKYGSYENLPTGAILGTLQIGNIFKTEFIRDILRELEKTLGDYSNGRFAWKGDNRKIFDKPIPAIGHQGLWKWDEHYAD